MIRDRIEVPPDRILMIGDGKKVSLDRFYMTRAHFFPIHDH
jgi:hypothetical protein